MATVLAASSICLLSWAIQGDSISPQSNPQETVGLQNLDGAGFCGNEARTEINQLIEESNFCSTDEDCMLLNGYCPLGCYIPVNIELAEDVRTALDDFRLRQEELCGVECIYRCMTNQSVVCENNNCIVVSGKRKLPMPEPEQPSTPNFEEKT